MGTKPVRTEGLGAAMDTPGIVLIDWWAPWCDPCRTFAEVFEASATAHGDLLFTTVNTEEEYLVADALEIDWVPTLMIFRDGVLLYEDAGALSAQSLEDLIERMTGHALDQVWERARESMGRVEVANRGSVGRESRGTSPNSSLGVAPGARRQ